MGKMTILSFLWEQFSMVPPVTMVDLAGKTVVLIGANTGLGFEACKHFARMNPGRLIMACRKKQKGEAAIKKLQEETDYQAAELWIIDLAQFSSVTAFVDKFEKDQGRLDILVENAVCGPTAYEATSDNWEMGLQVNCLSLSLLALRLLPIMIETGKKYNTHPRLVAVTSEVHFWSNIEKEVLDGDEIYKTLNIKAYCTPAYDSSVMGTRYFDSKLLNLFFYQGLVERLPTRAVVVAGVNPGYCISELRREMTSMRAFLDAIMEKILARSTEEGSRQLVYAALAGAEDDEAMHGKVVQNKLWLEMMSILEKIDPRVRETEKKYLTPME
ncbi:hypothetical protein H0H81_006243 [Sphagnurus paluster]|uniref:NAD(P)-binding protein n=1 Tax=Sphagnurus paluster TaxID=117069 RepID=A0A9P7KMW3_9AGAR|nr:hypothetical protein H0H81_006243 [Sphagnurus paluster]